MEHPRSPDLTPWPFTRERPLDPPDELTRRRTECPVSRVRMYDGGQAWLVTRYDDVRAVLGGDDFSSEGAWRFQPSAARAEAERGETSFTVMDPPEHTAYRRLFTKYFTVKRIAELRPVVEAVVESQIDHLAALPQPADLVRELAYPVATRTMCHLLGFPYDDHAWFQERAEVRSVLSSDPAEAARATEELLEYVDRLVSARLEEPRDDLISRLVHDLMVPGSLSRPDLVATVRLLLTAGHETTATMIGTGTYVLLAHPDQRAALMADPTLLPGAVEELLRYISMLHLTIVRTAKRDTQLAGCPIGRGEGLIATPGAANKDPAAFVEPDTFDVRRDARHHVAFGYGVHQCLGQPVARLELTTVFGTLFDRLPDLRLAVSEDEIDFNESNLVGARSLPVRW